MTENGRILLLYAVMAGLILAVGVVQSWTVALAVLNLCLISAIMALGVNIQWGYAGCSTPASWASPPSAASPRSSSPCVRPPAPSPPAAGTSG